MEPADTGVMPWSIYKSRAGEAEIQALYDEALDDLGLRYESLTVGTRAGHTHVIAVGPEDAPPVVFLPGGNFLNPTCLRWFSSLAADHRLYAPDLVGHPGRSSQTRPSPKGDGHAWWVEDLLDGLGLRRVPFVGLSYGAGVAIRTLGYAPERVSRAALVSPAAVAAGPIPRMLFKVALPMVVYRVRPTRERLLRAARPILTEPEDLAVRQLGAIYRYVRLDAGLPRMAPRKSFEALVNRWLCSPPRMTCSSPPGLSSRERDSYSPTSSTPDACGAAGTCPRGPRSTV